MTDFASHSPQLEQGTSAARYSDISPISNGDCSHCFSNHHHRLQYHHDDHQIDECISTITDTIITQQETAPRRKKTTITITSTTNGSASFLQTANESPDGQCDCQVAEPKKKKKKKGGKEPPEKGMKMRRLVVLLAVFILYVSLGAVVFNALEAGAEQDRKDDLDSFVEQFLERNPCVNRSGLYELLEKAVVDSEIVYYVVENKTHLDRWDFSGAFGFVVSVVTTIGFGNLSPFTLEGKAVCVVYAMFGIPLTLLVLGGLGEKMATCISRIRRCKNPMCHHTPKVNRLLNVLIIATLGIVLIFVAPALTFTHVEQWHFMESLYFCFTTLSTIGFGDYVIGIHETRLTNLVAHELYEVFAYVWILLGLAYLSLVYRYITDTMVAKAQKVERSTIRRLGTEFNKSPSIAGSPKSSSSRLPTSENAEHTPHSLLTDVTPERRLNNSVIHDVSRHSQSNLNLNDVTELTCQGTPSHPGTRGI